MRNGTVFTVRRMHFRLNQQRSMLENAVNQNTFRKHFTSKYSTWIQENNYFKLHEMIAH